MDEISTLAHEGGVGVIAVYILQYLKGSKYFPWLNSNSAKVNRWVGVLIALATSAGFKLASVHSPDGGYDLAIHIPRLDVVFDMITHAAAQFAGQQILYHTAVKDTIGGMKTVEMESGVVRGAVVQAAVGETKTEKKDDKGAS